MRYLRVKLNRNRKKFKEKMRKILWKYEKFTIGKKMFRET